MTGLNGSKSLEALPDSGADLTAADINILSMLGEDLKNLLKPPCRETSSVEGTIHVFSYIPGGLLVSWKRAKDLKILTESYPAQIQGIWKNDIEEENLSHQRISYGF